MASASVRATDRPTQTPTQKDPDFIVDNFGTIFLLTPLTPEAQTWIDENIPEDAQYFGNAVAVEPRYVLDIVDGIKSHGLRVV